MQTLEVSEDSKFKKVKLNFEIHSDRETFWSGPYHLFGTHIDDKNEEYIIYAPSKNPFGKIPMIVKTKRIKDYKIFL